MSKTRALYKAFGSNLEMPKPDSSSKQKIYSRFGMVAFWCIMVPISVVAGYVTYAMTDFLYRFGGSTYALLSELDLLSAFAMIFGLPLMFSVLFFSSDLKFLQALPVKAESLFSARFWHTYKAENVMTSNTLLAIFIGFFIAAVKHDGMAALHPSSVAGALIAYFACTLVPLIYCSLLGMLVMLLMRWLKNEKIYYHLSALLFVAFTAVFLLALRDYGSIGTSSYLDSLIGQDNRFTVLCNVLFPCNALCVDAIAKHDFLPILLAALFVAAVYFITAFCSKMLYRKGLFIAATLGSGRRSAVRGEISVKSNTKLHSLILKEFRVLMRTMTYRMNCIYVNFLWIAAAPVLGFMAAGNGVMHDFALKLRTGDPFSCTVLFVSVTAASFIASGLNSIASTSFTREGVHLDLIRYIPADIKTQIVAKAFVSVTISFVPLMIAELILTVSFGIPLMMLLYIPASFLCCVTACFTGMLMDSIAPYTIWSDELSALRGNLNCFFNLAAMLLIALVLGACSYVSYLIGEGFIAVASLDLVILVCAAVWGITGAMDKIRENLTS